MLPVKLFSNDLELHSIFFQDVCLCFNENVPMSSLIGKTDECYFVIMERHLFIFCVAMTDYCIIITNWRKV